MKMQTHFIEVHGNRLLMQVLIAAGIGFLSSTVSLAGGDVPAKSWAYSVTTGQASGKVFPSAEQACRTVFPEDKFLRAVKDAENRVNCFYKHSKEGYDYNQYAVYYVVVCPENARSEDSGKTCTCESNFEASGGKCVDPAQEKTSPSKTAGAVPSGQKKTAQAKPGNLSDPCLDQIVEDDAEPNKARCRLSWRAWDIKRQLHNNGKGLSVIRLTHLAIAVSEGYIKGELRTLVTTNDPRLHKILSDFGNWKEKGDMLGAAPKPGEHAEDVAMRSFQAFLGDKAKLLKMGTEPKACDRCTSKYSAIPWIIHERLSRE